MLKIFDKLIKSCYIILVKQIYYCFKQNIDALHYEGDDIVNAQEKEQLNRMMAVFLKLSPEDRNYILGRAEEKADHAVDENQKKTA